MTHEEQRNTGQQRTDPQQDEQGEHRRHDSAEEFHQAGADQVAHALHVVHDAGDQCAGFVGVVVDHGQTADMFLHFAPQLGDQALAFLGEELGEGERGDALNDGGGEYGADDPFEQGDLVLIDHIVDQKFRGARQDQAAQSADDHQQETEREFAAARAHEFLEEGKRAAQVTAGLFLGYGRRQDYALWTEYTFSWMTGDWSGWQETASRRSAGAGGRALRWGGGRAAPRNRRRVRWRFRRRNPRAPAPYPRRAGKRPAGKAPGRVFGELTSPPPTTVSKWSRMPPATSSGSISLHELELTTASLNWRWRPGSISARANSNGVRLHALLEQQLLCRVERPQAIPVARRIGLPRDEAQHVAVVDPDVAIAIIFPGQSQSDGGQHLRPGGPVDRLGIQQDAVEIEENGL